MEVLESETWSKLCFERPTLS